MISISDKVGRIRTDFTDDELASLSKQESEALTAVIKASVAVETAEENGRVTDAHVEQWAQKQADAEKAYTASLPKVDRIDLVRRNAEQQTRLALGMKPLPVEFVEDAELASAVKKCDAALNAARTKSYRLRDDIRAKRAALGAAIEAWQRIHAVTPEDHYRAHLDRVQAENRRIAAEGGKAAEVIEPKLSHLDAVMTGRRRTGHNSINFGQGRKPAR